jgi:hypothetical protein
MATIQHFLLAIRELVRILRALLMKYTAMIPRQAIAVLSKPVFSSFYPQPSRKRSAFEVQQSLDESPLKERPMTPMVQ